MPTKKDFLNLLELIDFRKIVHEILLDELAKSEKISELPLYQDEREDDPMDIDIAWLENFKDLLAVEGKVNGKTVQCLADSCANISFIQAELADELGLTVDSSQKHSIMSIMDLMIHLELQEMC